MLPQDAWRYCIAPALEFCNKLSAHFALGADADSSTTAKHGGYARGLDDRIEGVHVPFHIDNPDARVWQIRLRMHFCLKRHNGHQKFSSALVYSAVCKSKSEKQYLMHSRLRPSHVRPRHRGHVHFSTLAASMPMCPMSLSFENGPVPSLFLRHCSRSSRMIQDACSNANASNGLFEKFFCAKQT